MSTCAFLGPAGVVAGFIGGVGLTGLQLLNKVLPYYNETVVCEVRGDQFAKKGDLQYLAYAIAFGQLTGSSNFLHHRAAQFFTAAFRQLLGVSVGGSGGGGRGAGVAVAPWLSGAGILGAVGARIAAGAEVTKGVGNAAATAVQFAVKMLRLIPPAHNIRLEYDAMQSWVRFSISQRYSGLIDWTTGNQFGGRQRFYEPIKDEVVGGHWPSYFDATQTYLNIPEYVGTRFYGKSFAPPFLPDAGNLIATKGIVPGGGPPLDGVGRSGGFLDLVAADLLGGCAAPPNPLFDRTVRSRALRDNRPVPFEPPAPMAFSGGPRISLTAARQATVGGL